MRVVGVNGSGRLDGNTAVLVKAVLEGAAESGAETDFMQVARMEIAGCNGCRACKEDQRCVIQDDMYRFYDVAGQADVLVLGSPIYLDHATAQMKAFLDRLYCYIGPRMENCYPHKGARAVLCITYGAFDMGVYKPVLDWMKGRLKGYWGIETIETFTAHGTAHEPIIGPDEPLVRRARQFGRDLY